MGGAVNEMVSLDDDELGLAGPIVRESDDLVADSDIPDGAADCFDDAGKVAALSRRKCCGPLLGEDTLPDRGLAGVDTRSLDPDQDLLRSRNGAVNLYDMQDVNSAILVKFHRTRHRLSPCHGSRLSRDPEDQLGSELSSSSCRSAMQLRGPRSAQ